MDVSLLTAITERLVTRSKADGNACRGTGRRLLAERAFGFPAVLLCCLAITAGIFGGCSRGLVGKEAPAFELKDCRGKAVKLEDFRGKVVLIHFFATWAAPCRIMMPNLSYLQGKLLREPFQVIGIAVEDDSKQVARQAAGVNYLVLLGDEKTVKSYFGKETMVLPVSFLVDARGVIVQKFVGYYEGEEISIHVKRLMEKGSAAE